MKIKMNLKEIQEVELKMYLELSKLLDSLELKYALFYGSLLGAIRHHGFIPWDDDMDVVMPRKDYDKLIKYIKNNDNNIFEKLKFENYELGNGPCQYLKFRNYDYIVKQDVDFDKYLWIDIFPMDKVPEDRKKANKLLKKNFERFNLYSVKGLNIKNIMSYKSKPLSSKIKLVLYKICFFYINKKHVIEKMISESKKYQDIQTTKLACTAFPDFEDEIFNIEDFKIKKMKFEGVEVNGLEGYDRILKTVYGDYMKLPDEKNRKTHQIEVYRKEE